MTDANRHPFKHPKWNFGQIGLHLFFLLLCATYIFPFILTLSVSFSDEDSLRAGGFSLIPKVFSTTAYQMAFRSPKQLISSYQVTALYSIASTVIAVLVSGMMAYAMSRPNYRLRNAVTFYALFTMLFSGGMVPSYIINTKYLHMNDSLWVYILPGAVSAWNLIVISTNFRQLPASLIESAKIDGASEFRICFLIVFPLSVPVLATIGFLHFIAKWNDWLTASLYIRSTSLYSLQYLLQRILQELEFLKQMQQSSMGSQFVQNRTMPTESFRFAMAVLAAGPVLIVFPFFQKYFSKGLTIGAVKG